MTLVILEVSRKQDYIFSSRALKDNVRRSQEIAYVTGNGGGAFFRKAAGELFREEQLVSTGGGHTVLRFPDDGQARAFVSRVTEAALRRFPGMELYAKIMEYDSALSFGDNLEALTKALEAKKARRRASFGWRSVGVEALDRERWTPLPVGAAERYDPDIERAIDEMEERLSVPGWTYPREFGKILKAAPGDDKDDNFLAVVHIDGNAMGKRSRGLYEDFEKRALDFPDSCAHLRRFSDGIQDDFETAFLMTAEKLADYCQRMGKEGGELPIRPVILAGDDVTFVTAGRYGLECARLYLEALSDLRNPEDGRPYPACAGVALVHRNYPFRRAYDLAEDLCSEGKRFGAKIDPDSGVSVMDWHIEFGQLKDSLSELRKDYRTEDGNRLELRPVAVTALDGDGNRVELPLVPVESSHEKGTAGLRKKLWEQTGGVRTWRFFRGMCEAIRGEAGKMARGKIKNLREALKQGEVESEFYMLDSEIHDLLYHGLNAQYGEEAYKKAHEQIIGGGGLVKDIFRTVGDESNKRCLFFDAIEMMDDCVFFGEVET
ncbi:MAG: hypothetical protein IKO14_00255 [Oscillibacter sp.]|nr:hypothetical protein [Oscillibacter sp.]